MYTSEQVVGILAQLKISDQQIREMKKPELLALKSRLYTMIRDKHSKHERFPIVPDQVPNWLKYIEEAPDIANAGKTVDCYIKQVIGAK